MSQRTVVHENSDQMRHHKGGQGFSSCPKPLHGHAEPWVGEGEEPCVCMYAYMCVSIGYMRWHPIYQPPLTRYGKREKEQKRTEVEDAEDPDAAEEEEDGEEDDDATCHEHPHHNGRHGGGQEEGGGGLQEDAALEAEGREPVVAPWGRELRGAPAPRLVRLDVLCCVRGVFVCWNGVGWTGLATTIGKPKAFIPYTSVPNQTNPTYGPGGSRPRAART